MLLNDWKGSSWVRVVAIVLAAAMILTYAGSCAAGMGLIS